MTPAEAARSPYAGYWYLASPYTKFPGGLDQAFRYAVQAAGLLLSNRVPVFSPIAHTHPIANVCEIDPVDHAFWMEMDRPMMDAAVGLIVLRIGGWDESEGVTEEIARFRAAEKPVIYMDPSKLPALLTWRDTGP